MLGENKEYDTARTKNSFLDATGFQYLARRAIWPVKITAVVRTTSVYEVSRCARGARVGIFG